MVRFKLLIDNYQLIEMSQVSGRLSMWVQLYLSCQSQLTSLFRLKELFGMLSSLFRAKDANRDLVGVNP